MFVRAYNEEAAGDAVDYVLEQFAHGWPPGHPSNCSTVCTPTTTAIPAYRSYMDKLADIVVEGAVPMVEDSTKPPTGPLQ